MSSDSGTAPGDDRTVTGSIGDVDGEGARSRAGTAVAWILGIVLIVVGIFGIFGGGPGGILVLLIGLFVTPRTRRELKELCRIWHEGA